MGVYSLNQTQLGSYDGESVIANENYVGEIGAFHMMLENSANDQAIFEAVIGEDFKEAALAKSGAVNESAEVVLEAGEGFVEKIKEFLKKCWEKVKGIFKSLLTKINNVIIRDNKEFVTKYKKEVLTKDLSKMKYKWAAPKANLESPADMAEVDKKVTSSVAGIYTSKPEEVKSKMEKAENGDMLEEILSAVAGSTVTSAEFAKEFHDKYFNDEETEEGLSSSVLSDIINDLTEGKTVVKGLSKLQADADKLFKTRLKDIDAARNQTVKKIPGKGDSDSMKEVKSSLMAAHNAAYKIVSIEQTAVNKVISAYTSEVKFALKQARRVFAQAAAFNPKAVKESATFVEAAGDAAEYELTSSFADYSM